MRRRTSVSGDLDSKNCRTARRSSSCSSEKAKFTLLCSCSAGLAWESQHALTDDVVLDLARAGVDGLRATRHEDSMELVELVGTGALLLDEERVGTDHIHCRLAEPAMPARPEQFSDARLGTDRAAVLQHAREHAHPVEAHDLQPHVAVGQLVT